MILRRPYVFFIKMFKPIHVFMSFLVAILIYNTNRILSFFSNYISSNENVIGQRIYDEILSNFLFIVPIIIIVFCLIFLGIMFRKEKPIKFYVILIFAFIVALVINIYASNTINIMDKNIISIKTIKLSHDLILINMILETICFVLFFTRGIGLNYKNLDFDSDISKLDISDYDKEEIEISVNLNIEDKIRKNKKTIRQLKYLYKEHKNIVNLVMFSIIGLVIVIVGISLIFGEKEKKEGIEYNINYFNIKVNNSYLLTDDYKGNKVTDNYLVVVDVLLKSNANLYALNLEDFMLNIGNASFKATHKYDNKLLDLGKVYDNNNLQKEGQNYLIVFEIPVKYKNSGMKLIYNNKGYLTKIKLKTKKYKPEKVEESKKIGKTLKFSKTLGDISFKIEEFEIKDKFLINYNYCIEKNDCIKSKEYIKASIDQNFDKYVMLFKVEYSNNTKYEFDSLYDMLSTFGSIHYKIEDKWYKQTSLFEEIKSKRVKSLNKEYIGINSVISKADSIKLVFNIRNSNYEYILK